MARTINHIDLTVSDMARARAFYEPVMKYLGYEVSGESPNDLAFSAADGSAGCEIVLHPAHPASRQTKHDRYAPGLHHLAFSASSREDVDGLHRLLKEIGATILDPPAVYYPPDYYAAFFADPDGIKLELVHRPSAH
jgi:glyoxylase I family protein